MMHFSILGKATLACKSIFLSPKGNWSTLKAYALVCEPRMQICAVLGWAELTAYQAWCKFWVEQVIASKNCAIYGLSPSAGWDCPVFWRRISWLFYAILEPSRLPNWFVQFLEEGWFPSRVAKFSLGVSQPTNSLCLECQPIGGRETSLHAQANETVPI